MSYKKWIVVALFCFAAAPVQAAQAPITLEANYLQYNDETGVVLADGNVKMNQEKTYVFTQHLTGNIQTGDMVANGQVTLQDVQGTMNGEQLNYNYKTKEGKMGPAKGKMGKQLVTADSTLFHPENSESYKATMTKCPAKIPDYKMTAEKVVIYPGDKLIAYNAAFWIKNTKIYSMNKYVKRLDEKDDKSSLPSIGYRSDDGFYIKQHLAYPINNTLSGSADLAYYTKRGMRNQFEITKDYPTAKLYVQSGDMQNSDGDWYKREPEITYLHNSIPIHGTPLHWGYQLKASRIVEETTNQDMWFGNTLLWLYRDPIELGKKTTLNIGTSVDKYWYDINVQRLIFGYYTTISHQINDKMSLGAGYYYANESMRSPFVFDDIDINRELRTQFGWQVDRLWYINVSTSYDLDQSRLADVDYTIRRNLHCFETEIVYRAKRDELQFRVHALSW